MVSSILNSNVSDDITSIDRFLGDNVVQALCDRLIKEQDSATHSNKRKLVLRGNFIGSSGAKFIADFLKQYKDMQFLSLEWNQVACAGARHLSESLLSNDTLTHLDLRNNSIGTDGAISISSALGSNKTLQLLDLRWNQIEDQGALSFKDNLIERIPRLELLIGGNLLSESGAKYIEDWSNLGKDYFLDTSKGDTTVIISESNKENQLLNQTQGFQNELLQKEISHLRQQCISLQAVCSDAQRQLDSSSLRVTDLEQQLIREEYRSTHISEALKQANIRISVQADENHTLRSSWEMERATMNEALADLNKSHDQKLHDVTCERNSYRDKTVKIQDEISTMKIQLDRLVSQQKSEREADQLELNNAVGEVNRLKLLESRMSGEIVTFKSINSRLEDKVMVLDNELASSRVEFEQTLQSSSSKYIDDMEKKKQQHASAMGSVVEKSGAQAKEISDLKAELAAVSSLMVSQNLDLEQKYYEDLKKCRAEERGKNEDAVGELRQKIEVLSNTRADLELRCAEYIKEMKSLRESHTGSIDQITDHLQGCKTELERQASQNSVSEATVISLEAEKMQMTAELKELTKKYEVVQSEAASWNRELKAVSAEKQVSESKAESLEQQLEQLQTIRSKEFHMITKKVAEAFEKEFESLRIDLKILDH